MPSVYEQNALVQARIETQPPVEIKYLDQPWECKLLIWVPAANTKCRIARQGAGWDSNNIWIFDCANDSAKNGAFELGFNDVGTFTHTTPPPVQQWIEAHWGYDGTQAFIGWDDANYEYWTTAPPVVDTANNEVGLLDAVGAGASTDGYQLSDFRVWINNQAIYMRFPCDEGAGLVWEETENGWDGDITDVGVHVEAQPGYPTTGAGEFSITVDKPSAEGLAFQWEESADGINYQNVGTILTDTTGADTDTLAINSATVAMHETHVRCQVTTDNDGFDTSDSAQLLIQGVASVSPPQDAPTVLFSDLPNGPRSGWSIAESDKGAAVTIWGTRFGTTRGTSYVTVGSVNLTADTDYFETWGATSERTPWLQTICFRLNDTMSLGDTTISVTVDGVTGPTIPFHINSGRVRFMDPSRGSNGGTGTFEDPFGMPDNYQRTGGSLAGDICYIRAGTYTWQQISDDYQFSVAVLSGYDDQTFEGTATECVGYVGYPGEEVIIDSWTGYTSGEARSVHDLNAYWVISKLTLLGATIVCTAGTRSQYSRIVGNKCDGLHVSTSGRAAIVPNSSGLKILGNEVCNGDTGAGADHAIYIQGATTEAGVEVGYNYIHSNYYGTNSLLVAQQYEGRIPDNEYCKQHLIHHNLVDTRNHLYPGQGFPGATAIDIADIGDNRDPGVKPRDAEPCIVYNNIVYQSGTAIGDPGETEIAFRHGGGAWNVEWYNNTAVNMSGYSGLRLPPAGGVNCIWKGNVISGSQPETTYVADASTGTGSPSVITASDNVYYGGDAGSWHPDEVNATEEDPLLTIDMLNFVFTLNTGSPCIGNTSGPNHVAQEWDFNGIAYGTRWDTGALLNED